MKLPLIGLVFGAVTVANHFARAHNHETGDAPNGAPQVDSAFSMGTAESQLVWPDDLPTPDELGQRHW
jgi:hypothetical protein